MNTGSRFLMMLLIAVFTAGGIVSAANAAGISMAMPTGDAMNGGASMDENGMEPMADCDGCSISDDGILSCSNVGFGLCGGGCVISLSAIVQNDLSLYSSPRQHHVDLPVHGFFSRTVRPELHPPRTLS